MAKAKSVEAKLPDAKIIGRKNLKDVLLEAYSEYDPSKLVAYTAQSYVIASTKDQLIQVRDQI